MSDTDESPLEEEFRLAPPDPEIDIVREMSLVRSDLPSAPEPETDTSSYQFKIWHLMLVTLLVAITAASIEWFPLEFIAGFLGTVSLVSLVGVLGLGRRHPKLRLLWVVLMIMYLTVAICLSVQYAWGIQ